MKKLQLMSLEEIYEYAQNMKNIDEQESLNAFLYAAEKGHIPSQVLLGDIYSSGDIIEQDYDIEEFKDNEKAFVGAMYLDTGEYMSIDEIEKHLSEKITFMCPKNYELLNTANNQSYSTIVYDQGCLMDDYALAQHLAIEFSDGLQIGDNVLIKENGIDKYIGTYTSLDNIELTNIEENKLANEV